jgi:hypothetical protein
LPKLAPRHEEKCSHRVGVGETDVGNSEVVGLLHECVASLEETGVNTGVVMQRDKQILTSARFPFAAGWNLAATAHIAAVRCVSSGKVTAFRF